VIAASNFLTIQALRAIAALLVVVYHAFDMWGARIDSAAPGISWTNGAAGVDIFFVISGFVMVASSRRIASQPHAGWTFIQQRIVRIVPLYWLLTTAKLILVFFFADLALRSGIDFDYVARSYLFFPVVDGAGHFRPLLPVGWTLTYEFLFYLLFALALALRVDVLRVLVPGLDHAGSLRSAPNQVNAVCPPRGHDEAVGQQRRKHEKDNVFTSHRIIARGRERKRYIV